MTEDDKEEKRENEGVTCVETTEKENTIENVSKVEKSFISDSQNVLRLKEGEKTPMGYKRIKTPLGEEVCIKIHKVTQKDKKELREKERDLRNLKAYEKNPNVKEEIEENENKIAELKEYMAKYQ